MAKPRKNKTINIPENAVFIYPESIPPDESSNNPKTCLNPIRLVDERCCHDCSYEKSCIYYKKYKYYKPS